MCIKKGWISILILLPLLISGCGAYPFDTSVEDDMNVAAEIAEGRAEEAEIIAEVGEDCYEDIISHVPEEYSRCNSDDSPSPDDIFEEPEEIEEPEEPDEPGCPLGCTFHKPGCDIKGNISQSTGQKIYHVPGGKWYDETNIHPSYGERWFCTEEEARANGWRKSWE